MSKSKILKKSDVVSSEDVFHVPDADRPLHAVKGSKNESDIAPDSDPTDPSQPNPEVAPDLPPALPNRQEEIEQISKRILTAARAEHEKILRAANEDAIKIRRQARQEGFEEAFSQKREEIENALSRVDHCLEELISRQQAFFENYRRDLRELSLAVAEKIMNHSIEADPKTLSDLVMQAITSVKNEEWITVEVSEQLPELAAFLKAEYAKYPGRCSADFVTEDLAPGACLVQTPSGIIDASIGTQLDNLRTIFAGMGR